MKKLWNELKKRWNTCQEDDEYDMSKKHLSQNDKRFLLYGAFMMSMCILALSTLVTAFNNIKINRQYNADVEEVMSMIATYMATATEDEYEEIAKSIRNDLVFSEYGKNIENAIKYIPNTADHCRTCTESYPAQAYLLCTNTGMLYEVDILKEMKTQIKEIMTIHL